MGWVLIKPKYLGAYLALRFSKTLGYQIKQLFGQFRLWQVR